jgi:hypothetical protein
MRPVIRCRWLLALLCLLPFLLASAADPKRDWKKYPAVVEVDTKHDIYALGDVHGDFDRLVTVLAAAKIIPGDVSRPENAKWLAGKAVLVCPGDSIDKWNQNLAVLQLFRTLQAEAEKEGGRVILTLGNHEAEFLSNPKGKKTADFANELRARNIDPEAVAAGTDAEGIGAFLRSLPVAARVNDWFFAHAGPTHNRSLAQLSKDAEAAIEKDGWKAPLLLAEDGILEARLHPHPWWEKPGEKPADSRDRLANWVKALGCKHLVLGHQPGKVEFADGAKRQPGELFVHFDGLVFLIDVGMSRGVGYNPGAILHVHQGSNKTHAELIPASGAVKELWKGE